MILIEPGCELPDKDEWVLVYEDDTIDQQQVFISRLLNQKIRQRVTPAKLLYVCSEGWPVWYLCYAGASHLRHTRNETYWAPIPDKCDL